MEFYRVYLEDADGIEYGYSVEADDRASAVKKAVRLFCIENPIILKGVYRPVIPKNIIRIQV